jgi:hypothetical protein
MHKKHRGGSFPMAADSHFLSPLQACEAMSPDMGQGLTPGGGGGPASMHAEGFC